MDDKIINLEKEVFVGAEHQATWDKYIEPFFLEKTNQLFEYFKTVGSSSPEVLMDIKKQLVALESLQCYFIGYIKTGELAQVQLETSKEKSNGPH
jgi:hypothetical protein